MMVRGTRNHLPQKPQELSSSAPVPNKVPTLGHLAVTLGELIECVLCGLLRCEGAWFINPPMSTRDSERLRNHSKSHS